MPAPRILPPVEALIDLRESGLTNAEIAARVSTERARPVTPQAISQALSRAGRGRPPVRYRDLLPWTVRAIHSADTIAEMLRAEARLRRDLAVPDKRARQLRTWKQWVKDNGVVIFYEPVKGFHYIERQASYPDDIVVVDPNA